MRNSVFLGLASFFTIFISSCGAPTGNTNLSAVNTNSNVANSVSNSNLNAVSTTATSVDTREPDQYQATVKLGLETIECLVGKFLAGLQNATCHRAIGE